MNRHIIILAGGKGTRMHTDIPKVLYPLKEKPILGWLLENLNDYRDIITLVVGFQGEKVQNRFGENYNYVWQKEQLGTGHAIFCAKEALKNFSGDILVLYGDHPLVTKETVDKLFQQHQQSGAKISLMTANVDDFEDWHQGFYHFGRILRDEAGQIKGIRELVDSSDEERKIKEINPAYFCFNSHWLWENIDKIQTNNKQKEYYLTDLIALAFEQDIKINSVEINPIECLGINTQEHLHVVEKLL